MNERILRAIVRGYNGEVTDYHKATPSPREARYHLEPPTDPDELQDWYETEAVETAIGTYQWNDYSRAQGYSSLNNPEREWELFLKGVANIDGLLGPFTLSVANLLHTVHNEIMGRYTPVGIINTTQFNRKFDEAFMKSNLALEPLPNCTTRRKVDDPTGGTIWESCVLKMGHTGWHMWPVGSIVPNDNPETTPPPQSTAALDLKGDTDMCECGDIRIRHRFGMHDFKLDPRPYDKPGGLNARG